MTRFRKFLALLGALLIVMPAMPLRAEVSNHYFFVSSTVDTTADDIIFTDNIAGGDTLAFNATCIKVYNDDAAISIFVNTKRGTAPARSQANAVAATDFEVKPKTRMSIPPRDESEPGRPSISIIAASGTPAYRVYASRDRCDADLDVASFDQASQSANNSWTGTNDFAGVTSLPGSNTPPATCTAGRDVYIDTNATTGSRWLICESTNTWVAQGAASAGDVVGPSSSVDNALVRFNSTTGKIVKGYTSGAPTCGDTGACAFSGATLTWKDATQTYGSSNPFILSDGDNTHGDVGFPMLTMQADSAVNPAYIGVIADGRMRFSAGVKGFEFYSDMNSGSGNGATFYDTPSGVVEAQFLPTKSTLRMLVSIGTAPVVSNTSANSCGTTAATLVGTDTTGAITVGATAGTSCTVTFTVAATARRQCWANNETTGNLLRYVYLTTTTGKFEGTMVAGDVLDYGCLTY